MPLRDKELFEEFIRALLKPINEDWAEKLNISDEEAPIIFAKILHAINSFFYLQGPTTGRERCSLGDPYFSDFHKFWEKNHKEILGLKIVEKNCQRVAERLERHYQAFPYSRIVDTTGLSPNQIANVRLFTAIQDWGLGFRTDPYQLCLQRPELFNARMITKNPTLIDELLRRLGAGDYQVDKRREWAKRCARLLVDNYGGDAFNLAVKHGNNARKIREVLARGEVDIGLSDKKADMFLRDMIELGVWNLREFEEVDVPSDMNTMRIALRTGIVKTNIPLLSSFMDVFCYQYEATDSTVSEAWREVWELWRKMPENHAVRYPGQLDTLIYNMGRNCCKKTVRRCDIQCNGQKQKRCTVNRYILTRKCGGWCIFKGICSEERRKLNPPKSISQRGRTSWSQSYSNEGGGLGLRA